MEDVEEEPIMDIDGCDKKNPLAVVEYVDDLYNFYKKAEVSNHTGYGFSFEVFAFSFHLPNSFTGKLIADIWLCRIKLHGTAI
jgi:hypothetical protein